MLELTEEQKEYLNDGLLEFQENYFQTIQFKVKKMMKNKLGYLYDNYFMDVYHHDEITNRHQIQLEALIQIMIMVVLLFSIFICKQIKSNFFHIFIKLSKYICHIFLSFCAGG